MRLRELINENSVSKKVNNKIGKGFENSNFAIFTETVLGAYKEMIEEEKRPLVRGGDDYF